MAPFGPAPPWGLLDRLHPLRQYLLQFQLDLRFLLVLSNQLDQLHQYLQHRPQDQ